MRGGKWDNCNSIIHKYIKKKNRPTPHHSPDTSRLGCRHLQEGLKGGDRHRLGIFPGRGVGGEGSHGKKLLAGGAARRESPAGMVRN